MNKRIDDKIIEIEEYLGELESILPKSFEEYDSDWKIKDICERHFEKIIEAIIDLGFLVIKENNLKIPDDDKGVFDVLSNRGIISHELCEKLREAKGMRNIIAHEYGKINDELVFEAISEQLGKDIQDFINKVKINLK